MRSLRRTRLDLVGRLFGGTIAERPPRQGLATAVRELVAIEFLAGAVALDDEEAGGLDALVGRESGAARGALAAPANGRGASRSREIHDPGVSLTADGTSHPASGPPQHHYGLWCCRSVPLDVGLGSVSSAPAVRRQEVRAVSRAKVDRDGTPAMTIRPASNATVATKSRRPSRPRRPFSTELSSTISTSVASRHRPAAAALVRPGAFDVCPSLPHLGVVG